MSQIPDRYKVLRAARDAGPAGVHSHDLRSRAITGNPSQRIRELKDEGYQFTTTRESRNGRPGVRWVLLTGAPPVEATTTPAVPEQGARAFDNVVASTPRCAIFDDYDLEDAA